MSLSSANPPPQIDEIFLSVAAAGSLRPQSEQIACEADLETRKAEITALVREACQRKNLAVSDHTIDALADAYGRERFVFRRPKLGPASLVARAWIHRAMFLKRAVFVVSVALAIAAAADFLVLRPLETKREAKFRQVQLVWSNASNNLDAAEGRADLMLNGAEYEIAKTSKDLGGAIAVTADKARAQLSALADQIHRLTGEMKPARYTLEAPAHRRPGGGWEDAAEQTQRLEQGEKEVDRLSQTIDVLVDRFRQLQHELNGLETAWTNFLAAGPSSSEVSSWTSQRDLALRAIRDFEPPERVATMVSEITRATEQIKALAELPEQIRAAARKVESLSSEPEVTVLSQRQANQALVAVASNNLTEGRAGLAALNDLANRLDQEFILRIVNQPNEYTRIWTYKNNNHAIKSYYVIVEAIGPKGQALPQAIRSEEDGSIATVTRWAERVDLGTYEAVGQDKQDDGIVESDTFGRKQRGHLHLQYLIGPKTRSGDSTTGRIHRWPRKTS